MRLKILKQRFVARIWLGNFDGGRKSEPHKYSISNAEMKERIMFSVATYRFGSQQVFSPKCSPPK